jgi:hypothetical protein
LQGVGQATIGDNEKMGAVCEFVWDVIFSKNKRDT